ncbi:MAG TPA: hypothetical protein VGN72_16380 [Tepidisphaeraceae bacterium]|jgi:hypothetical protein|nr:hypothetical protein [Tepidisphaeraceae bacterium]
MERVPPVTDQLLPDWARNVSEKLALATVDWGVAEPLRAEFILRQAEYSAAIAATADPSTMGPLATGRKNEAKRALLHVATLVVAMVRSQVGLAEPQRYEIGIRDRKSPTRRGRPTIVPRLRVLSVDGRTVTLGIRKEGTREEVANADSCMIFIHMGEQPPQELSEFTFAASASRATVDVTFPADAQSFATVWLVGFFVSGRKENGPACEPISTNLGKIWAGPRAVAA